MNFNSRYLLMVSALSISIAHARTASSPFYTPPTPGKETVNVVSRPEVKVDSNTAVVYIRNENNQEITVLFKPQVMEEEDPSVLGEDKIKDQRAAGYMKIVIPANSLIQVIVKQSYLGPVKMFSITGEVDTNAPVGKADNLSYNTFYVVRFTQNAFGTNCYTEKLDGAYPNFPQVKVEGVKTHIELPTAGAARNLPKTPTEGCESVTVG